MRFTFSKIVLVMLFGVAAHASAQVRECIDANGKKLYVQDCPYGTVKQREMETNIPVLPAPENSAQSKSMKDRENEFDRRKNAQKNASAAAADDQKKADEAKQICANDKARLDMLQSGRASRRVDPETGDHVAVDDDQRMAEIGRLTSEMQDKCK